MGRLGTPEDIGNVVLSFCTEKAGWITGQVIYADGGASLMNPEVPPKSNSGRVTARRASQDGPWRPLLAATQADYVQRRRTRNERGDPAASESVTMQRGRMVMSKASWSVSPTTACSRIGRPGEVRGEGGRARLRAEDLRGHS